MLFPYSYMIFMFSLLSGSIISISSMSWFAAWVGLELNLMSFLPLITSKPSSYSSEAALKYFLVQALASALLIMASFLYVTFPLLSSMFILLTLLTKLACPPFHFWFPQVMEGLDWMQAFLLASIQKLAPLALISYLMTNKMLIEILIGCSILASLIGALGGLNLMSLRKIIAFSSINHMSWMLIAISIGDVLWLLYFLIYMMILLSILSVFYYFQTYTLSHLMQSAQISNFIKILISFNFLSLGGLPPFTGFIPKWILVQVMMNNGLVIPLFFLLFSALITFYFYMRIIISFLLFMSPVIALTTNYYNHINMLLFVKTSFNIIGLILPLYLFMI